MTEQDRFDAMLRALFETFSVAPTPGQLLGYRMALEGVPLEDFESGVRRALQTSKFLPKPAELRELCGELTVQARAALAWAAAKKAVHRISAYGSVDFADPVINAVVHNLGGWKDFCGRDSDTFESFTRKDFERIYMLFAINGVDSERGAPCKGIHGETPKKKFPVGYQLAKPLALPPVAKAAS